jgi:hypothetical protein
MVFASPFLQSCISTTNQQQGRQVSVEMGHCRFRPSSFGFVDFLKPLLSLLELDDNCITIKHNFVWSPKRLPRNEDTRQDLRIPGLEHSGFVRLAVIIK